MSVLAPLMALLGVAVGAALTFYFIPHRKEAGKLGAGA